MKNRVYYHVIEESNEGIGTHGYYETENEANEAIKHLESCFDDLYFYVYVSLDASEPPITTV